MFLFRRKRRRRSASRRATTHYLAHKEAARAFIHARLAALNSDYGFSYRRVFIKNQRSCWGSCSERGNLNFNYRLLFLPAHLADYVVAHELCHLAELNHSPRFWAFVAEICPEYRALRRELRKVALTGGLSRPFARGTPPE